MQFRGVVPNGPMNSSKPNELSPCVESVECRTTQTLHAGSRVGEIGEIYSPTCGVPIPGEPGDLGKGDAAYS